jgi:hypothetical protein
MVIYSKNLCCWLFVFDLAAFVDFQISAGCVLCPVSCVLCCAVLCCVVTCVDRLITLFCMQVLERCPSSSKQVAEKTRVQEWMMSLHQLICYNSVMT